MKLFAFALLATCVASNANAKPIHLNCNNPEGTGGISHFVIDEAVSMVRDHLGFVEARFEPKVISWTRDLGDRMTTSTIIDRVTLRRSVITRIGTTIFEQSSMCAIAKTPKRAI